MKLVKFKGIEKSFLIESGNIYNINIENINYYKSIVDALNNEDDDYIVYSEDYKPKLFTKESIIIYDYFSMDPNNRKILNILYKKIQDNYMDEEDKIVVRDINTKILNLFSKIELNTNLKINYEVDLELSQLLSLYKFTFDTNTNTFLEKFIIFIKANMEIKNISFIISLNILPIFNENEISRLKVELNYLGISLININLIPKKINIIVDNTIIDDDLCEI